MFSCGKKKHKKQSDLSNVAKMAEAIDDDINNSGRQNKSNVLVVGNVSINDGNHSGNGDASCLNTTNNRTSAINRNQNSRRSIQRFSCSRCCNDIFNYLMRFRASPEEVEQRIKSREIDRYLEKDKHTFRRQVKFEFESHESTTNSILTFIFI